jgi:hypothetical protein
MAFAALPDVVRGVAQSRLRAVTRPPSSLTWKHLPPSPAKRHPGGDVEEGPLRPGADEQPVTSSWLYVSRVDQAVLRWSAFRPVEVDDLVGANGAGAGHRLRPSACWCLGNAHRPSADWMEARWFWRDEALSCPTPSRR